VTQRRLLDWCIVVAGIVVALIAVLVFLRRDDVMRASLDPQQPFQTWRPPAAPNTVGIICGSIEAICPAPSGDIGSAFGSSCPGALGSPVVAGSSGLPVPSLPGSSPAVAASVFSW